MNIATVLVSFNIETLMYEESVFQGVFVAVWCGRVKGFHSKTPSILRCGGREGRDTLSAILDG